MNTNVANTFPLGVFKGINNFTSSTTTFPATRTFMRSFLRLHSAKHNFVIAETVFVDSEDMPVFRQSYIPVPGTRTNNVHNERLFSTFCDSRPLNISSHYDDYEEQVNKNTVAKLHFSCLTSLPLCCPKSDAV